MMPSPTAQPPSRRGFTSTLAAAIAVLVCIAVLALVTSQSHVTQGEGRDVESAVDAQYAADFGRTLTEDAMRDAVVDTVWQACDCRKAFPGNPNNIDMNASVYANLTSYFDATSIAFNKTFFSTNYSNLLLGGQTFTFNYRDRYGAGNTTYCNGTGTFGISLTAWSNTTFVHAGPTFARNVTVNVTRNEETPVTLEIQIGIKQGSTTTSSRTVRFTC